MKPNLFDFATSELSQDAFFCWFLSWSCEKYKDKNTALYTKSRDFIKYLLPQNIFNDEYLINKITIKRQFKNIDFCININDSVIMLFEDKIGTKNHDDQLDRYSKTIKKEYPDSQIYKYYLKTDLVWPGEIEEVNSNNYKIIDIFKISDLLKSGSNSDIYEDFISNINFKIKRYKNYRIKQIEEWGQFEWIGFLYDLRDFIDFSFFGKYYVGEGFWFVLSWRKNVFKNNCHVSIELNNRKLVIKTHVYDKSINKRKYRDQILPIIKDTYAGYDVKLYNRTGKCMTLLEIKNYMSFASNGLLKFNETVENIKIIKQIFDDISIN